MKMDMLGRASLWRRVASGSLIAYGVVLSAPGIAQDAAPPAVAAAPNGIGAEGDIIVTARKREESALSVPVVLSAVSGAELQRRAINNMDLIARAVPGVIIGEGGATIQGGTVAIRGLTSPDTNGTGEQAVAFNIDGVAISRASPRRLASMDLAQVEVLKGPQTLFFGKNSPGGVISIRTADPTPSLQGRLQSGYEFVGHEFRNEGYIAGPITDTLGFRVAGYYSHIRGWVKNLVPETSPFRSDNFWGPRSNEAAARLTLLYNDNAGFTARLKANYSRQKGDSPIFNVQRVNCPLGAPQPTSFPTVDDCRPNNTTVTGELGPTFQSRYPYFGDGKTGNFQRQYLNSLELTRELSDNLTLTAVTGHYDSKQDFTFNSGSSYEPGTMQAGRFFLRLKELGQELRLASSFDGPLNFTLGGFAQSTRGFVDVTFFFNANNPTVATNYRFRQKGTAYSAFGQLMWNILPTLELSGGVRYSHETKSIPLAAVGTNASPDPTPVTPIQDHVEYSDYSPELTLTYRPTNRLTIFTSYKRGFLSGGFNTGSQNVGSGFVYRPETVKGFEGGVKALLLDGRLRTNFSLYDYRVSDLQVVVTVGVRAELRNAASIRMKGAEWDFSYRLFDGFSLTGAVAYSHARYGNYLASCYAGQPSPECSLRPSPYAGGAPSLSQVLDGARVDRAPDWSGNAGFDYEKELNGGLKLGIGGNMTFTSGYFTSVTNKPAGRQSAYQLFDANVRLATADNRYEIALIGRSLGNKYYFVRNNDIPFTGANTGGAVGTTTLADTGAAVSRGREIMLRLTVGLGGR